MLTLNNVSKNFGKFTAVENISLNMDNKTKDQIQGLDITDQMEQERRPL